MSPVITPPARHSCSPPRADHWHLHREHVAGSTWECPACRRVWVVVDTQQYSNLYVVDPRRWVRAGLVTAWLHRRQARR